MKKLVKRLGFALLAGFVILFLTLLPTADPLQVTPLPKSQLPQVNWDRLLKESTQWLVDYIKIPTIRGNEDQAHRWMQDILKQEGIEAEIIPMPGMPGRSLLMAQIGPLEAKGGVILASHSDVVDVTAEEWTHPPFSGLVKDGRIHGRGAVDMKGMGVMQLSAFIALARLKLQLKFPVMLLVLPDEETGSKGAKYLVDHHLDKLKNYQYLLNEGGMGTQDMAIPNSKIFNLQYAEKGMLWLKLESSGLSGHGSTPREQYAAKNMVGFLEAVANLDEALTVTPETKTFFYQLGSISEFPNSFLLKRMGHPLIQKIAKPFLFKNRHLRAMTTNTRSITGLRTDEGLGLNVITPKAFAKLDMRLLPNTTPEKYYKKLEPIAERYGVKMTIFDQKQPSRSPTHSAFFQTMAAVAMRKVPGSIVTPFQSTGLTDNSVLRQTHLQCYGLIPALFKSTDIDMMHGKNESLTQQNLLLGTQILFETIIELNRL